MKKGDIHALWAPLDATWTPWVKPVLFAHLDEETTPGPAGPLPAWIQAEVISPLERHPVDVGRDQHPYRRIHALDDVAAVIDLPGAEGALAGLALARTAAHHVRVPDLLRQRPAHSTASRSTPGRVLEKTSQHSGR